MNLKHAWDIGAWLKEVGCTNVRIQRGARHPRIYYTWDGREQFYVIAGTPGDHRSIPNAISDLRHKLGLVPAVKRVGERKHTAAPAPTKKELIPSTPLVTLGAAWQDLLQCHPLARHTADARLRVDRVPQEPELSPAVAQRDTAASAPVSLALPQSTVDPTRQDEPPEESSGEPVDAQTRAEPTMVADMEESMATALATKRDPRTTLTPAGQRQLLRKEVAEKAKADRKFPEEQIKEAREEFIRLASKSQALLMNVTPVMAHVMLDHNSANRAIKLHAIGRYVEFLRNSEWLITSQTIGFSDQKVLVDGQNRLYAILQAKKPMRTWVIFGVDRNAFKVTDTGEKRRVNDALQIMGESSALNLGAALRGLHCYMIGDWTFREPMTVFEGEDLLKSHGRLRDSLRTAMTAKAQLKALPVTAAAVCHYVFSKIDRDMTDQFFNNLKWGTDLKRDDPEYVLRQIITQEPESIKHGGKALPYAMLIRAWNARRQKWIATKSMLKHGTTDEKDFPEPK